MPVDIHCGSLLHMFCIGHFHDGGLCLDCNEGQAPNLPPTVSLQFHPGSTFAGAEHFAPMLQPKLFAQPEKAVHRPNARRVVSGAVTCHCAATNGG